MLACVLTTPLGKEVVPEVYKIIAGRSEEMIGKLSISARIGFETK